MLYYPTQIYYGNVYYYAICMKVPICICHFLFIDLTKQPPSPTNHTNNIHHPHCQSPICIPTTHSNQPPTQPTFTTHTTTHTNHMCTPHPWLHNHSQLHPPTNQPPTQPTFTTNPYKHSHQPYVHPHPSTNNYTHQPTNQPPTPPTVTTHTNHICTPLHHPQALTTTYTNPPTNNPHLPPSLPEPTPWQPHVHPHALHPLHNHSELLTQTNKLTTYTTHFHYPYQPLTPTTCIPLAPFTTLHHHS